MVANHCTMTTRLREYHTAYSKAKNLLVDWDTTCKARVKERDEAPKRVQELEEAAATFETRVTKKAEELSTTAVKKAMERAKTVIKAAQDQAAKDIKKAEAKVETEVAARLKEAIRIYLDSVEGQAEHRKLALSWVDTEEGQEWLAEESLPAFEVGQRSRRWKIIRRGDSYDLSWTEEFLGLISAPEDTATEASKVLPDATPSQVVVDLPPVPPSETTAGAAEQVSSLLPPEETPAQETPAGDGA